MQAISRMGKMAVVLSAGAWFGCGGGGGTDLVENPGSPPPGLPGLVEAPANRVLEGAYELIEITFVDGGPVALLGTIAFDQAGGYSLQGHYSLSGQGANQEYPPEEGGYEVDTEGRFFLVRSDGSVLHGAIVHAGDLFFYSNISTAGEPSMGIGLKPLESGHSNLSLSGGYRLVDLAIQDSAATSIWAGIQFDGRGSYELEGRDSSGQPVTGQGSYEVHPDGTGFSLNASGESELEGAISILNNLFIYARISDENEQRIGLGIQGGGVSHSYSSMQGDYELIDFATGGDWAASSLATMSFHADGSYTVAGETNRYPGGILLLDDFGSYTVASDGTLAFRPEAGVERHGALSADGKLFIYSNISTAGAPSIGVAVRR